MLLSELHTSGFLKEYYNDNVATLSPETLAEENDAKIDIYNYAARFDSMPQFSMKIVSRRSRGRSKKFVEVTVTLPEQHISATGHGHNLREAEIAASVVFKRAAEEYYAKTNTSSLIIKDDGAINSKNAKQFIDFYQTETKHARFEVIVEDLKSLRNRGLGDGHFQARVLLNGEELGEPIEVLGKKRAEDLAYLPAALELKRQNPELFPRFLKAPKTGDGEILRPIPGIRMEVEEECLEIMKDTLHDARAAGLPDAQEGLSADIKKEDDGRKMGLRPALTQEQANSRSESLSNLLEIYQQNPKLADLRAKRDELPMNQYTQKVLDLVNNNLYSIIIGATGSGKTTQVPQILLDNAINEGIGGHCNIICTQPRRIAATSVARRVAVERNQPLGRSVGYHVRFDAKLPQPGGSVTYCTTGILLQQLQHAPDEILDRNTHLIIDEVHERDILIDFLLIVLKRAITERQQLRKRIPKIVLMSATIDAELFAGYFQQISNDGNPIECPSLSVPGRTFPVTSTYLPELMQAMEEKYPAHTLNSLSLDKDTSEYLEIEGDFQRSNSMSDEREDMGVSTIDWKKERKAASSEGEIILLNEREDALVPFPLVALAIAHITNISDAGAILVFLPGLEEILKVEELLLTLKPLRVDFKDHKYKIIKVHSSLASGQTDVFEPVPQGVRKIILSTNIAETSVTIPDVQYVLDAGKLREKRYDQVRRITRLACTWISKSNATQRAGRAGRVQNGNYIALFSRQRYESLRAIGLPEMLRSDLQEICLDIKAQAFKSPIREFLSEAIEPPSPSAVESSILNLQALEALTEDEELTPLGRLLASLPVHPSLGKMIILGIIFRCLDPMLVIGAIAAERSLFTNPLEQRAEANRIRRSFAEGESSDLIAIYKAFKAFCQVREERGPGGANNFAFNNFLHLGALRTIEAIACQIEEILVDAKLIPFNRSNSRAISLSDPSLNENSSNIPLIKALALAGHHPNLAVAMGGRLLRTPGENKTMIHPSSVNYPKTKAEEFRFGRLFTYSTMQRSNDSKSIFLRDTTESTPLMACLFGGRLRTSRNDIIMDSWLPFYIKSLSYRGDERRALKILMEFRKAMDRMLSGAFQDLTTMSSKTRDATGRPQEIQYLADAEIRRIFTDGVVQILGTDGFQGNSSERDDDRDRSRDRDRDWRRGRDEWRPSDEERESPYYSGREANTQAGRFERLLHRRGR
jgi:ATP-dependent RNA helicase DHX36